MWLGGGGTEQQELEGPCPFVMGNGLQLTVSLSQLGTISQIRGSGKARLGDSLAGKPGLCSHSCWSLRVSAESSWSPFLVLLWGCRGHLWLLTNLRLVEKNPEREGC